MIVFVEAQRIIQTDDIVNIIEFSIKIFKLMTILFKTLLMRRKFEFANFEDELT